MSVGEVIGPTGVSEHTADLLMDRSLEAGMIGVQAAPLAGGDIKPDRGDEWCPVLPALPDRSQFESEPLLDVGWGGDVRLVRHHLPDTFLSIRLDPVTLVKQTPAEIRLTIRR